MESFNQTVACVECCQVNSTSYDLVFLGCKFHLHNYKSKFLVFLVHPTCFCSCTFCHAISA